MMVMEKTEDIAVLMSMGTRRSQIRNILIAQGVLIGIIGTVIGLLIGYAISFAGGHYHLISLSPEVYSIDYVPFAPRLKGRPSGWHWCGTWVSPSSRPCTPLGRQENRLPAEALRYE